MLTHMDRYTIIKLKERGYSNRQIAVQTGVDRKTVAKYWNEYSTAIHMPQDLDNWSTIQSEIVNGRTYDTSHRMKRKYNDQIDDLLDEILASESVKAKELGATNKQHLTNVQIHSIVRQQGYNIGRTVISRALKAKRKLRDECFIKQEYEMGRRLEYDFGEVRLLIKGDYRVFYLAVLSAPASKYRWAFMYRSQDKSVFLESHVRFFEMLHGSYREVVYDNMKNVVTKFIGPNQKELNQDLIRLSLYYGFDINVTNCFSGNEKGYVESSVKKIRNTIFAMKYQFTSEQEAELYLAQQLKELNRDSTIETEKLSLLPYRPPLDLAKITHQTVNKYSFVQVNQTFYSVPDYLVGREVSVHVTAQLVRIYSNRYLVAEHKKVDGYHATQVDIRHYLDTFRKKPGALPNALALRSIPHIKAIYDTHFTKHPQEFIAILTENAQLSIPELEQVLLEHVSKGQIHSMKQQHNITDLTKSQIQRLTNLYKPKQEDIRHANQ